MSKSDEKEYTLYGSIKGMNEIIDARDDVISSAVSEIGDILEQSRKAVAVQVNQALVATYWKIGEIIVKYEQNDHIRATYGEKTLRTLSKALTRELGKGFSQSNVYNMRQLYICYPKFQTVSGKLSWPHYCELLSISDDDRRMFYEKECINSSWSVRELKRQIDSSLFETGDGSYVSSRDKRTVPVSRQIPGRRDGKCLNLLGLAKRTWLPFPH